MRIDETGKNEFAVGIDNFVGRDVEVFANPGDGFVFAEISALRRSSAVMMSPFLMRRDMVISIMGGMRRDLKGFPKNDRIVISLVKSRPRSEPE